LTIGVATAAPWFVAVSVETSGEFARVYFWYHNVGRAAGTAADLAHHPAWFYFARWAVDWLPWSPLFVLGLWTAVRKGSWQRDREMRLALAWVAAATALLTASRFKRADYLIPAYPGAAILLGCVAERVWHRFSAKGRRRAVQVFAVTVAVTLAAYVALEAFLVRHWDRLGEKRSSAAAVRRHARPGEQIVFFRVEDHLLAYHLGKPVATVLEWENLDVWVSRLRPGYVLMPVAEAAAWPDHIRSGRLQEIERFADRIDRRRPRTWVLLRSTPNKPE
jgi:hypothetical protein